MIRHSFFLIFAFNIICLQGQIHALSKPVDSHLMVIENKKSTYAPLDTIFLKILKNELLLIVEDGKGKEYVHLSTMGNFNFQVGGELGHHAIYLVDKKRRIVDKAGFFVDCKTEIIEESRWYQDFFQMLYWSMIRQYQKNQFRINGKFYATYAGNLTTHVYTLKGLKYFTPSIKSTLDLFADYQRDDGMVWDFVSPHVRGFADHWDDHLAAGNFVMLADSENYQFRRYPTTADIDYLFIEGIYQTWKATGDHEWMHSKLPHAVKAVSYIVNSPYRWSEKKQLLKRGFTIDMGSTMNDYDISNDRNIIISEKTPFGIMFGDNTGLALSCMHLAEMLEHGGKKEDAEKMRKLGNEIQERIDALAWNGNFYKHFIPEDEKREYDMGVNRDEQVSFSNALSLSRRIDREKCINIIRTYQKIKDQKPITSPGEWYTIYPPFTKGFSRASFPWETINGGVTPIVAGELAQAALSHGLESYGIDIFRRIDSLASLTDDVLYGSYRGAMPEPPKGSFTTISLSNLANADIGMGNEIIPGWTDEKENNIASFPTGMQVFHNIPFDITSPLTNQQRACIVLSESRKYLKNTCIELNRKAASIYLLHAVSHGPVAGTMVVHYDDSSSYSDIIGTDKVFEWWYPREAVTYKGIPYFKLAWRGENKKTKNIGVGVYGFNNPYPHKTINHIEFIVNNKPAKWMILGITLSENEVFFMPSFLSYGLPDSWSAASMINAVVEGMAGVKDEGIAFNRVQITPRWTFDNIKNANVTIRYGASNGYVAYRFNYETDESKIILDVTGNARRFEIRIPLPSGKEADRMYANGRLVGYETEKFETSKYLKTVAEGAGTKRIVLYLK